MRERYGLDANGFLDYADEALSSLRGAKDRAIHLKEPEMAQMIGKAMDIVIAASSRAWDLKDASS